LGDALRDAAVDARSQGQYVKMDPMPISGIMKSAMFKHH
jgi:hypothetical protein